MTTAAKQLAKTLADYERRLRALERAPRLKNASIEAATLPVFDADQVLRQTIGQQPDGTYTVVDSNGAPPPVPTPPVLEARPGTLVVTWDGQFADAVAPADWSHVEVHVSTTSGYTPTDETQVATFNTLKGGSVTLALDPVAQYVVLQAVNTSRVESAPTAEVSGTPTVPVLTGGVKTYYEDNAPAGLDADDDGSLWFDTNDGNKQYRWNGGTLVWVSVQDAAIGDAQAAADAALAAATTDGLPPTASPDPFVMSGIGYFIARWDPITNADPVKYQVHISPTLGFTATFNDPDTMLGFTTGTQFTVKQLPGPDPAPGDPDPRTLDPDTTYYVRVIAYDDDGPAAQSLQAVAMSLRVTGPDIAVNSIAAANILAGTLTGELFAATVILAGTFKTADSGQRVEVGIAGIQGYKSDGSLMINFPTDPTQTALIDAEIIARGLTVTNGATLRAATTVDTNATVNLKRVVTAPQSAPQMVQYYDTIQPSTATLTAAQKTDILGTFDLVPTEVSFIEFKDAATDYWVIHQVRPNGTRAWFFHTDGTPYDIGGGVYLTDYKDWEIWSVINITTSTPAKNGVYRMARWIPSGAANTYYLMCPQGGGFNRYSRQNGTTPPVVGSNGTDVYVAEIINSDQLNIRYFAPNGDGTTLSNTAGPLGPLTAYVSSTGFVGAAPLSTVLYDANGFDVSVGTGGRYLTGYRGVIYNNKILNTSGTNANSIFPSGSGNNWAASTKDAHSFEAPTLPRCVAWDGTQFWTYGADGFLYKHTTTFWDPSVNSSTVWSEHTFYDSNATGGTHESTPGPIKSFTWKRRSSIKFSLPPLPPGGGTDDPNTVRTYMGRGSTQPTNANMWFQFGATGTTATVSLITLAGTNPPTVNNFPNATPAAIVNDAGTLAISGDGSVKAASLVAPTVKVGADLATGDDVAIKGPYAYCILNGNHSTAGAAFSNITNWQAEVAAFGIVLGSGTTLTVPRAGRYKVTIQLSYPTTVTSGSIWADVRKNGAVTPAASFVGNPNTSHSATVGGSKTLTLAANDTLQIRSFKSQAGAVNLAPGPELTYWQLEWVGP